MSLTIKEAQEIHADHSRTASEVARTLAFAGIALLWVLSGGAADNKPVKLPRDLLWPGGFLVLALTLDLLHYFVASVRWDRFARAKEEAGDDTEDAPASINNPAKLLWYGKIVFVLVAYVLLGSATWSRIR